MSESGVKTDEKKQHFDDIYVAESPVPFKERIMDELQYVSDDFNRQTFDRLILPWVQQRTGSGSPLKVVDLAACFGNTTMATVNGMSYDAIRANWRDEASAAKVASDRRFPAHVTGIDISANAMAYGASAGVFDDTIVSDLNQPDESARQAVDQAMANAEVVISTASLVYLDSATVDWLVDAFARGSGEGYMLVNFLNPFALEKADEAKNALLSRLEFVGSMASRHRLMSGVERDNYPGEDWALLEIWVLRRRG
jgi:hypothetical protein